MKEEYDGTIENRRGQKVQVFFNPSRQELDDIKKDSDSGSVRFMIHSKKKHVYAFNGDHLHGILITGKYLESFEEPALLGVIERDGKVYSDQFEYLMGQKKLKTLTASDKNVLKTLIKTNWSFAYRYIPGLEKFLEKRMKQLKEDSLEKSILKINEELKWK
jgi:hypothetical protein